MLICLTPHTPQPQSKPSLKQVCHNKADQAAIEIVCSSEIICSSGIPRYRVERPGGTAQ